MAATSQLDIQADPYHKIITAWERDPATNHKTLVEGKWATPELAYLHGLQWEWTEKVDGTNIRVQFDGTDVTFGGKTNNAQIPPFLFARLAEIFTPDNFIAAGLEDGVVLYGEGFGARIQKGGGNYLADRCDFVLFDVKIDGWWLHRNDVYDISGKLNIAHTPVVGIGPLNQMIELVRGGFTSHWGDFPAEGLVGRPTVEMFTRAGHRIITKIKSKDFRQ